MGLAFLLVFLLEVVADDFKTDPFEQKYGFTGQDDAVDQVAQAGVGWIEPKIGDGEAGDEAYHQPAPEHVFGTVVGGHDSHHAVAAAVVLHRLTVGGQLFVVLK